MLSASPAPSAACALIGAESTEWSQKVWGAEQCVRERCRVLLQLRERLAAQKTDETDKKPVLLWDKVTVLLHSYS